MVKTNSICGDWCNLITITIRLELREVKANQKYPSPPTSLYYPERCSGAAVSPERLVSVPSTLSLCRCSARGPSHGTQSFRNWSCMHSRRLRFTRKRSDADSYHGGQTTRSALFQHSPSAPPRPTPHGAAPAGLSVVYSLPGPHPLLHCGLLHDRKWRRARRSVHGLREHGPLLLWSQGLLLPEHLLRCSRPRRAASLRCSLLSPSYCGIALFSSSVCSARSRPASITAQLWQGWVPREQREPLCSVTGSAGLCSSLWCPCEQKLAT